MGETTGLLFLAKLAVETRAERGDAASSDGAAREGARSDSRGGSGAEGATPAWSSRDPRRERCRGYLVESLISGCSHFVCGNLRKFVKASYKFMGNKWLISGGYPEYSQ
ncbi:hypothetical protein [Hoeflea sp. IMCC20628]|uniref:hypothetical protein n=1 Tax=Hoeflea sp. IMCC20628 TaxID=1620421 RepID=UPI0018CE6147|nr:hypothetical protein [Hoeflea sp. IMCC20628]